jgi:hypothetical protein
MDELHDKIAKHVADSKSKVVIDAVAALRQAAESHQSAEQQYGTLLAEVTEAAKLIADAVLADTDTDIGKRMAELRELEAKDRASLAELDRKDEDLAAREAAMSEREQAVKAREDDCHMTHVRNATMASKLEMLLPGVLEHAFKAP